MVYATLEKKHTVYVVSVGYHIYYMLYYRYPLRQLAVYSPA